MDDDGDDNSDNDSDDDVDEDEDDDVDGIVIVWVDFKRQRGPVRKSSCGNIVSEKQSLYRISIQAPTLFCRNTCLIRITPKQR